MKILSLLIILNLLSLPSWSAQIFCQKHPRDVAVAIDWLDQDLSIQVFSPLGYTYMPQIEGPLRPSSLDWSRYQFQQLEPLGSRFEVRFKKNDCEWTINKNKSETKVECGGKSTASAKELLFTSFSLVRITESTLKNQFFTRRFRFSVVRKTQLGDDTFFVTIPVSEQGCQDYE